VCVDVERDTGLIDPAAVRAATGPRTAAILPVHLYGQVCEMDDLLALAAGAGVAVFEDAAQAHGATYRDRRAGSFGRASAFSFYPSKNLGALGDGGAITTNDGELARALRRLRDLGKEHRGHSVSGYNERLDGLQAAFLTVKLVRLDDWNARRRAIADRYRARLADVVQLLQETPDTRCMYHLLPIRVADRDALAASLAQRGIGTGVHYPLSLPEQPALPQLRDAEVPIARDWAARELSLPMFPELTEVEVDSVCDAVAALAGPAAVAA
jgi:dTDP-4-amino-4,6-dideoxygalactose transaminase